jgi:hypothetical protein
VVSGWSPAPVRYSNQFEMIGGIENAKLDYLLLEVERRG